MFILNFGNMVILKMLNNPKSSNIIHTRWAEVYRNLGKTPSLIFSRRFAGSASKRKRRARHNGKDHPLGKLQGQAATS